MTTVLPPSAPPATSQPQTGNAPSGEGRKANYTRIFGITSIALTLVAIALAVVAPLFSQVRDPLSDGWQKVYDSDSQPFSTTAWDESDGCSVTPDGLHASSQASCVFKPSKSSNLTGSGFVIDATIAPPGAVESAQVPLIYVTNHVLVGIDQTGSYFLCLYTCNTTTAADGGGHVVQGQADDWHAATNVANTIAVRVTSVGTTNTLQLFTNGQFTASIDISSVSLYSATVTLGAEDECEALFTRVAIYSASA